MWEATRNNNVKHHCMDVTDLNFWSLEDGDSFNIVLTRHIDGTCNENIISLRIVEMAFSPCSGAQTGWEFYKRVPSRHLAATMYIWKPQEKGLADFMQFSLPQTDWLEMENKFLLHKRKL